MIVQHQSKVIEDTKMWEKEGYLAKIPFWFEPDLQKVTAFFEILFDHIFSFTIINETNKWGKMIWEEKWKKLTSSEFEEAYEPTNLCVLLNFRKLITIGLGGSNLLSATYIGKGKYKERFAERFVRSKIITNTFV